MIFIETKRLILRNWKKEDLNKFILINSDREIMNFFPNTLNKNESITFYNNIIKEISENNFGLFACEEKKEGNFIGFIGLHKTNLPSVIDGDFIEIGWRLHKNYWNKGLATEGAKACINYGFFKLNLEVIYSFTSKLNIPSKKVMEKLNMVFIKNFNHPRVPYNSPLRSHVLYYIKK